MCVCFVFIALIVISCHFFWMLLLFCFAKGKCSRTKSWFAYYYRIDGILLIFHRSQLRSFECSKYRNQCSTPSQAKIDGDGERSKSCNMNMMPTKYCSAWFFIFFFFAKMNEFSANVSLEIRWMFVRLCEITFKWCSSSAIG